MKIVYSYLAIFFSCASLCTANDSYSEVPLTAGDLKSILKLNVQKFRIDFAKPGYPRLEINDKTGNPIIVILPHQSKSATIITYLERGAPDSKLDMIHFWFSNERNGHYSYFQFYSDKANHTVTKLNNGNYNVVASKSKEDADVIGYTIQITSIEKRRTSESSEPPPRPELKSK